MDNITDPFYTAAFGVPLQPPSSLPLPSHANSGDGDASRMRANNGAAAGRRRRAAAATTRTDGHYPSNSEAAADNTIMNPAFWAAVFTTLRRNEDVTEEIRRDIERQEARLDDDARRPCRRARGPAGDGSDGSDDERRYTESARPNSRDQPMDDEDEDDAGTGSADERQRRRRVPTESLLPDMYDFMTRGFRNPSAATTVGSGPVQRLDLLMDELDVGALWSARDVMISFGPLARVLLRLFVGPYATDEENLIVRMLNLGVERASRNFGFQEYRDVGGGLGDGSTEPFHLTYRRRGRALRDFAAFRFMLEIAENMGRIGRKHKHELILLYMTLTTPEVRLHRRWNADDREHVIAFRDRVTGFAMTTPPVIARPMSIEMHLDSVFGNVSTNTRLLERSLSAALNNRNRRSAPGAAAVAREVESLLGNARRLDLTTDATAATASALRSYPTIRNENAALKHMLQSSAIVSMMAEEYRVFVAGAPASRCGAGNKSGPRANNKRSSAQQRTAAGNNGGSRSGSSAATVGSGSKSIPFRRPIFFTFKPTSHAVTNDK